MSKRLSREKVFDVLRRKGTIRYYFGYNYLGETIRVYDHNGEHVGHITKDLFAYLQDFYRLKEKYFCFLYEEFEVEGIRW